MKNHHVTGKSFNQGNHLISNDMVSESLAMLETAMNSNLLAEIDISANGLPRNSTAMDGDDFWPDQSDWFAALRPYKVSADGILTIPIKGVLLHGVAITYGQYMTGYDYIMRAVQRGQNDPYVKGFFFHINSPGGHVSGCFDVCDLIFSLKKPTVAFAADTACSAAYAIAASCGKIIGTQTCRTGSIGVLSGYVDYREALDKAGVKYLYISAPEGGLKSEGHIGGNISKELLDKTQADANECYAMFLNCVTRNRPITEEQIRATKALTYQKDSSLEMGLIDMVASSVDIAQVASEIITGAIESQQPGNKPILAHKNEDNEMTAEEKAAMIAAAKAEGIAEGQAAGQTAASKRIADVLGSPETEGREELAKHMAFNTQMDAAAIIDILKISPKATAAPTNPAAPVAHTNADMQESFDKQMQKHAPNLDPNTDEKTNDDKQSASIKGSLALAQRAGLAGYKFDNKSN